MSTEPNYSWVGRSDEQIAFASSGLSIAVADNIDTVRLFDTTTGNLRSTLVGHTGQINEVVWQPNGMFLATKTGNPVGDYPSDGGTVRIWDGNTGQLIELVDHQSNQINSLAWLPDSSALAIASHHGQVQVWDSSHKRIWFSEQVGEMPTVFWSPHGYHLLVYSVAGSQGLMAARILHPVTGKNSWGMVTNFSQDALAWTEDDRLLHNAHVSCSEHYPSRNCDMVINPLFDAEQTPISVPYYYEYVYDLEPEITLEAHLAAVNSIQWNQDATYIAANDVEGELRVWKVSVEENELALSLSDVIKMNWSPDGQRLGVVRQDNTVELWNVVTGEMDLKLNENGINHILWSPDGTLLATWGENQATLVWNVKTGEILATLEHSEAIIWSPDSSKLAQNHNGTITIWGYS